MSRASSEIAPGRQYFNSARPGVRSPYSASRGAAAGSHAVEMFAITFCNALGISIEQVAWLVVGG